MPLIVASLRAQTIWARFDPAATLSVIGALGSVAMKSVSSREGIVIAPSSSTVAVIQLVIAISRFVAESLRRPSSVATQMCDVWGSVLRVATARATTFSPRWRVSCSVEMRTMLSKIDKLRTQLTTLFYPAIWTETMGAASLRKAVRRYWWTAGG